MSSFSLSKICVLGGLVALTACSSGIDRDKLLNDAKYWQRANVAEAAYMEGPKAQQTLHRDISRCVAELRELERLGALRDAVPANPLEGPVPAPKKAGYEKLAEYETPQRDGYLRSEYFEYTDFESCMIANGWERVEFVPFDTAVESRKNYIETITGKPYRKFTQPESLPENDNGQYND